MAHQWIVKLAGQDDDKETVLIHVTSKGSEDLDLDLVATESTTVFKGKLRKRKLKTLTAKNYNGKEDEWEAILQYALLEGKSSAIGEEQERSLEVGASVKGKEGEKTLSITFRNRIDDITQRIGAIELSQDDEEEISLFDWTTLAVNKNRMVEDELSRLSKTNDEDKTVIARLQSQLAELVKAKAEHEEQMLSKFVLLLNAKKTKIRDQQRLLQTAVVDEDRLKKLKRSIDPGNSRDTTRAGGKRSAPNEDDSEADESQAFETQKTSRGQEWKDEDEDEDEGRQTTPDSTESEPEDEDDQLPIRGKKTSSRKVSPQKTRKAAPTPASKPSPKRAPSVGTGGHNTRSDTQMKAPESLEDDDETASEDDEL